MKSRNFQSSCTSVLAIVLLLASCSSDDGGSPGRAGGSGGGSGQGGARPTGGSSGISGTSGGAGSGGSSGSGGAGGSAGRGGNSGTGALDSGGGSAGSSGAAGAGGDPDAGRGGAGGAGGDPDAGRGGAGGDPDAGRGGAGGATAGTGGRDAGTDGTNGGAGGSSSGDGGATKSPGCGSTSAPTSNTYTISVGGTNRTYILRVADNYDANRPYRLILAYHPLGGTAQQVASGNYYGLLSLSAGSTIFAAPQGIGNGWSDSGRTSTAGGADINFTKALVDELTSKLCIDRSRIFAEGFSMGGSMSYAVACAMGDVVRGVVAHSGGPMSGCVQHSKPVAYFMTHGTQDDVCTYPAYGVPQVNDFASVNGCMSQTMPTPSGTAPACVDFPGCMPGYPTRACIFVGGHTPSPTGNWVPAESWKFISQF
jgi:polyhydroxybutyrate depolymerase